MTQKQLSINEIIERLRAGNLDDPKQLSDFLVMMSASLLSAKTFETEAEIEMARKWLELKKIPKENGKEKSDSQIDMEVKLAEQYKDWKKMKNANETIEEVIMALKKKLGTVVY